MTDTKQTTTASHRAVTHKGRLQVYTACCGAGRGAAPTTSVLLTGSPTLLVAFTMATSVSGVFARHDSGVLVSDF